MNIKTYLNDRQIQILLVGLTVLALFAYLKGSLESKNSNENNDATEASPDTQIPKGFVLAPIEIQNAEAISGMIDSFAIVDLYLPNQNPKEHGIKIGSKLRLIRAPLNPKTFAVLVPEKDTASIVNAVTPVIAVIQNRNLSENGSIEKTKQKSNRIQYYSGESK